MATVPQTLPVVAERWDLPDVLLVPMDSLDAYFARVYQIPLLTREEEAELGTAVRAGNRDAALRLAVHNLRYAAYLARKWEGRSKEEPVWSLGDAVQAANIGLWAAVQRYDPSLARFTTYAHWWIRQSWDRARNTFLWQVRLPAHAVREWHAYQQAVEALTRSRHAKPKPEELAGLLGWPLHRIAFWQQWAETTQRPASLDALVLNEDTPLGDLVAGSADDAVWSRMQHLAQKEAIDHLLEILTPREADVLRLRFGLHGLPMTLQEVGDVFHLTRERIRQIEAKALKKLQSWVSRHPEFGLRDLMTD